MTPDQLKILYEDNHLLVLDKPAGLATMGEPAGVPTLLEIARQYIKQRYQKPGNVYLGVVSRVDALVTGVVVFARTSKAADRLTEQFRTREVEKTYLAIVDGAMHPARGQCVDWIFRDDRTQKMQVAEPGDPRAKESRLEYRRLAILGRDSLLEVRLETGRKHQIRLQMAHRGHSILGDSKYGSRRRFPDGIALHAYRLAFTHPVRGERLTFTAPLPDAWQSLKVAQRLAELEQGTRKPT